MFRLGTSEDLWIAREEHPGVFLEPFKRNSLKPLGHAMVTKHIKSMLRAASEPIRVLEVGHGATSQFFDMYGASDHVHCYGMDDHDQDKTVSIESLKALRDRYPRVEFFSGYLGRANDLPGNFFDLIFSVSVIEHIKADEIINFHNEAFRLLKPGGLQLHSYDRPWGGDVSVMKNAIESSGFEWIEPPKSDMDTFWKLEARDIARVVFEHPFNVMEYFMHASPRENRVLYNWVTVFVGARKPESQSLWLD